MSLEQSPEEMRKQLAEISEQEEKQQSDGEKEEVVAESEENAEAVEEKADEAGEGESAEKKEEEKVAAPEKKEEEKLDDAGYARLRREKAAAEKKARELEEMLAAKAAAPEAEEQEAHQENPLLNNMLQEYQINLAAKEFMSLEDKFKQKEPNYDAVATEYASALAQSIRIQNPRLSSLEVAERTKKAILEKAGEYVRKGFDPVEEMYHEARELGFDGSSLKKKEEPSNPKSTLS